MRWPEAPPRRHTARRRLAMLTILGPMALSMLGTAETFNQGAAAAPTADEGAVRVADIAPIDGEGRRLIRLSPDGRWLAALEPGDGGELCLLPVGEGLGAVVIRRCVSLATLDAGLDEESLAWSPDSTRLVFAEKAFRAQRDGDLWLLTVDGEEPRNLTDDGFAGPWPISQLDQDATLAAVHVDVAPTWPPAGREIAFSRSTLVNGEFAGNDLMRLPVDLAGDGGSGAPSAEAEVVTRVSRQLPGVVFVGLVWTTGTAGDLLVYAIASPDDDDPTNGLWSVSVEGGEPRRLRRPEPEVGPLLPMLAPAGGDRALVVAPTSFLIGPLTASPFSLVDLATARVTPIEPTRATAPDVAGADPLATVVTAATLSPDGRHLLYAVREGVASGRTRLIARDLDSGKASVLAEDLAAVTLGYGRGLDWANDGTVFVASSHTEGTILHLVGGGTATPAASPVAPPPTPGG